ncbi:MAG: aspartate aminotransferase family protein [Gammaproteobacteria bacterium]|nr:aspartate aminotransferase family protein [Gammaproteobacteria bacterium]
MTDALMTTYNRQPVSFERGEGVWLWDVQGKKYLDAISGIAVCGLGHAHPKVADTLCQQGKKLIHTSNIYGIANQEKLAVELTRRAGMERAFFGNSGAEANEAAIKLARLYGHNKGVNDPTIIVMEGSFHGRTLATLTATGNRKIQAGFEPLVHGFVRAPYGDVTAVEHIAANNRNMVAILVEPVQGEGGINIPDKDYLAQLRRICDQHGWLLMLDEIQTGMGRTGKWFAYQHGTAIPDVITVAKALGNGMPIGACLARGAAANVFKPGNHGSTFGGNPLACAVGLTVIESLEAAQALQNASAMGARLANGLREALAGCATVKEVRDLGLMIGIELNRPCGELVGQALAAGLLINVTSERVIRLLPPLIIQAAEVDQIVATLNGLIRKL